MFLLVFWLGFLALATGQTQVTSVSTTTVGPVIQPNTTTSSTEVSLLSIVTLPSAVGLSVAFTSSQELNETSVIPVLQGVEAMLRDLYPEFNIRLRGSNLRRV